MFFYCVNIDKLLIVFIVWDFQSVTNHAYIFSMTQIIYTHPVTIISKNQLFRFIQYMMYVVYLIDHVDHLLDEPKM